jgi:uracil-DNA glycosylase family 4
MSLTREQMLAEMGLAPIWRLRETATEAPVTEAVLAPAPSPTNVAPVVASQTPVPAAPQGHMRHAPVRPPGAVDALDWPELAEAVAACKACQLCQQRKQAVLGVGDLNPDWLFVGEGPGAEEDVKGEPFVGQAGKLLDNMLAALDIARGDKTYIGNAVKCRPPGNRTPEAAEMAACRPWLERQIALLQPKVIVLLGKAAVHSVLRDDSSLASLRGRRYEYQGIPVVVTYHPAYLLRNLPEKAKAWEDLLFARRCLRERLAGGGGELSF